MNRQNRVSTLSMILFCETTVCDRQTDGDVVVVVVVGANGRDGPGDAGERWKRARSCFDPMRVGGGVVGRDGAAEINLRIVTSVGTPTGWTPRVRGTRACDRGEAGGGAGE